MRNMCRWLPPSSWRAVLLVALVGLLLLRVPQRLSAGANLLSYWVQLSADGGAVARAVTNDDRCPSITLDGQTRTMDTRAPVSPAFPVLVCEAAIPAGTANAAILNRPLALPNPNPGRVLVVGDMGCRIQVRGARSNIQDCNDPRAWPAARIAQSAAELHPDLIVHVGDILYRESPCSAGNSVCAGSAWGDNWEGWKADFFTPLMPLLPAAPWLFVRGDHESCGRAGDGWFRLLDPRPVPADCQDYTDPYAVSLGTVQLLVFDSSNADDYEAKPEQVSLYREQFAALNRLAGPNAWLLTHRTLWAFGHLGEREGDEVLFRDNPTLQAASQNVVPAGVQLLLAGHIHLFEGLSFASERPPQLVIGNSGTELDPPIETALTGLQIAGGTVMTGETIDRFGFATLEPSGSAWRIALRDTDGQVMLECATQNRNLQCAS